MYLTAHRVVSPNGAEGINAFVHLHGRDWTQEAPRPDQDPGELVDKSLHIEPPSGNRVHSYIDIVAPDHYSLTDLHETIQAFIAKAETRRFPVALNDPPVYLAFSLEQGLANQWADELDRLLQAVMQLLQKQESARLQK